MRRSILAALVCLVSAPAFAQSNIIVPDATCAQLEPAWKLISSELTKDNYVSVIARAYFENKLVRRRDGGEVTLENLTEYVTEASAYDNLHFVVITASDFRQALEKKKCTFENTGFKWDTR